MKNIRGALFVLSLSIILLFNSTTVAQSKAYSIWMCSPAYYTSSYKLIKFKSLKLLNKSSGSSWEYRRYTPEEKKKWETKILNGKNCKYKIEKQSYAKLYGKLRNDFKIEKVYGKWDPKNVRKTSEGYYERTKGPSLFEYYAKDIGKDTLAKLSKKYNEYPLKNLASTTQTQQVAKKKEPSQTQKTIKGSIIEICGVDQGYQKITLRRYPNLEKYKKSKALKSICSKVVDESNNINLYKSLSAYISEYPMGYCECERMIDYKRYNSITKKYGQPIQFVKIQFAKKEPSQTQQVAKKEKKKENIKANQNLIDKYFGDNSPKILIFVIVLLGIPIIGIFILKSKSKQKTKPFARAATSGAINQYAWKGKKILKYKNWGVIVPAIVLSIWFGEKYYNANPDKAIQQAKQVAQAAKKTGQDWKCKLFDVCQSEEKTQQVAKKIINIYCVKNNYSAIRMAKGEKPNCKNGEFKVVKNEYLLLETVYDNLASYFDLNDPNEVVLFDRRVRDIFKITHQDFNKLTKTKQVAIIESTKKSFNIFKKEEKKITIKEVLDLGKYTEFNAYPEGMLKEFKNCKKQFCRGKIAGKQVYEIFARRGDFWHQRHPGDIIHGMAWFEIFYLEKLRNNEKQIVRYIKNGPKGYSSKTKMRKDVSSLHGLITTNKGRIKMREALGLNLNDDLETVLKRHWLLGDFLNKDKLKVKRVAIGSDIKKRKELLAKYKSALTRYKNKLDEERRATN